MSTKTVQPADEHAEPLVRKIALRRLKLDSEIQCREHIDKAVVEEYADAMKRREQFPPPIGFQVSRGRIYIADGFHRFMAAKAAGLKLINVEIRQGPRRDALLYAATANVSHGLRRSTADKRRAIQRLLDDADWSKWSDCEIARRCGVSDKTVTAMRNSGLGNSESRTRSFRTRHGTVGHRLVSKTKQPSPPPADFEDVDDFEQQEEVATQNADGSDAEKPADRDNIQVEPGPAPGDDDSFQDPPDDNADQIIMRATEAIEAMVVLGAEIKSAPPEIRQSFLAGVYQSTRAAGPAIPAQAEDTCSGSWIVGVGLTRRRRRPADLRKAVEKLVQAGAGKVTGTPWARFSIERSASRLPPTWNRAWQKSRSRQITVVWRHNGTVRRKFRG